MPFSTIFVITWRLILLVEETGVSGENHTEGGVLTSYTSLDAGKSLDPGTAKKKDTNYKMAEYIGGFIVKRLTKCILVFQLSQFRGKFQYCTNI